MDTKRLFLKFCAATLIGIGILGLVVLLTTDSQQIFNAKKFQEAQTREISPRALAEEQSLDNHANLKIPLSDMEDVERKFTNNEITLSKDLLAKGYKLTSHHGEMTTVTYPKPKNLNQFRRPKFDWIVTNVNQFEAPTAIEYRSHPDWFFAWVQIQPEFSDSEINTYFDIEHFEVFAGPEMIRRAKIPNSKHAIQHILASDAIVGIGLQPTNRKLDEVLHNKLNKNSLPDSVEVFITLMTTSEVHGWIQKFKKYGVEVHRWDPTIRVLVASIPVDKFFTIVQFDVVQAVEEVGKVTALLDSATIGSGVDALRTVLDTAGLFDGNTASDIPIGVMDTGLNLSHRDISTHRTSICGESFVLLDSGEVDSEDLWIDYDGHGTHVTGILAGNGYNNASLSGVAPGVQHIRIAKVLRKKDLSGAFSWIMSAMDYFAEESSCLWEGNQTTAARPLLVNMSLGSETFSSSHNSNSRKLDWIVWKTKQLYIVSMGNYDQEGYSQYAAAKNSLSIGALADSNLPYIFSSWGPTIDGRIAPNVTTIGKYILSARGNGSRSGYDELSGTSMSSSHAAGISALLMQAIPEFRENPALVRAQLMATSLKPQTYFEGIDEFYPRTNSPEPGWFTWQNGMGALSARTAILQHEDYGWSTGSATSELADDEYAYIEIEVPENTKRLDIVLTWDEPPSDFFGSAVISDIDLYLGPNSDCDPTECADYSSNSRVDNVEYLIIDDPTPGTLRISIVPFNVYQFEPTVAVAWKSITGETTPQLNVTTETTTLVTEGIKRPQLNLTVAVDSYLAAGTYIHFACRASLIEVCDYWYEDLHWQPGSYIERSDGSQQSLAGVDFNIPLLLGEIIADEERDVRLIFPPEFNDQSHQLYIKATSMNAMSAISAVDVVADDEELPEQKQKASNDDFRTPIKLTDESVELEVDLLVATSEPSESWWLSNLIIKFHELQGFDIPFWVLNTMTNFYPISSLWYSIETDRPETIELSLEEASISEAWAFMYLTTNDSNSLTGDRFINMTIDDSMRVSLQPHQQYYLWISSVWRFTPPKYTLRYERLPGIPKNDMFAQRTEISGESGFISGFNEYATTEPGEPGAHQALSSLWYEWTAPENSSYDFWNFTIDQDPEVSGFVVQVYEGNNLETLRLLSEVSLVPDPNVGVVFPIDPGANYKIKVASWENSSPDYFLLRWEGNSDFYLMDNDMFSNAIEVANESGATEANQTGADIYSSVRLNQMSHCTQIHTLNGGYGLPRPLSKSPGNYGIHRSTNFQYLRVMN